MKPSGIGGQAVIEGVMMKNKSEYAVAVRKPDNEIEIKKDIYIGIKDRIAVFGLPILRGIAAFLDSLILGMRTLNYSADFYEDNESKEDDGELSSIAERRRQRKEKRNRKDAVVMGITLVISIIIAVLVFIMIPFILAELFKGKIESFAVRSIIEGVLRLLIFILYIKAITLMKDIKRVFMYHGAEHKVINCIEHGEELTVANAKKQTKEHKRCGTSFLMYVVLISIIVFVFIQVDMVWLRMLLRIILVPFIAGIAYEFIRLAGRYDNKVVNILSKPGMWLQGLTTKEPDDDMLEVAIASVEAVFDWRAYQEGGRRKRSSISYEDQQDKTDADTDNGAFESLSVEDDEDDEILKALDRYLKMEDEKDED